MWWIWFGILSFYYWVYFQIEVFFKVLANESPEIYELNISSKSKSSTKGFLLFGEHPREMISPETGLNLVKALCLSGD